MAEAGCLRDVAVQNLEVIGNATIGGVPVPVQGVGIVTPAVATGNYTTTIAQPANTVLTDLICVPKGGAMVTAGGGTDDVNFALGTNDLGGEIVAAKALLDDAGGSVTWPQDKAVYIISNRTAAGVDAFAADVVGPAGPAKSEAFTITAASLSTTTARTLHVTFSPQVTALTNAPTTIRVIAKFDSI